MRSLQAEWLAGRWSARAGLAGLALGLACLCCLHSTPVRAQGAEPPIYYSRQLLFRIPFEPEGDERQLQQVQLYVSEDRGQSWQKYDTKAPDARGFNFRAERNGLYWFTVRTQDVQGRFRPQTLEGSRPQLRVIVDTQAPMVTLRSRPAREGLLGIEWDIREENPDLTSFSLEYRLPGSGEWLPLPVTPGLSGDHTWSPGTNGAVDVRLRLRDLAKNEGEAKLTLTPGDSGYRSASSSNENTAADPSPRSTIPERWVKSKRVSLNYEIKEKGPSGVSAVELWIVSERQGWKLHKKETNTQSPIVFDVPEEGRYGITLIVRNGVGLGEAPPRNGDPPQLWLRVDLTKPIVHWVKADVGRGADLGKLKITWMASDKYLSPEPITISYAEDPSGQWTTVATKLPNTGSYIWPKGPGAPHRFRVRVEATDLAGNVGSSDTTEDVLFDLAQPKSLILGVEPAGTGTNSDGNP